jgi:hypothetical protein
LPAMRDRDGARSSRGGLDRSALPHRISQHSPPQDLL